MLVNVEYNMVLSVTNEAPTRSVRENTCCCPKNVAAEMIDLALTVPCYYPREDLLNQILNFCLIWYSAPEKAGKRLPERAGLASQCAVRVVISLADRHPRSYCPRRGGSRAEGKFSVHDCRTHSEVKSSLCRSKT
jgi:ferredoxin-thioredoxin reductase catalytic subunit